MCLIYWVTWPCALIDKTKSFTAYFLYLQVLQDKETEHSILAEKFAQLQENVKVPSNNELVSNDSQVMKSKEHNF